MRSFFFVFTVFFVFSIDVNAKSENGVNDCLTKSLDAALNEYAQTNSVYPFPEIRVAESDGSPSNGIDIMVTINSKVTYYVIASPEIVGGKLVGCVDARVGYVTDSDK